jgi:hypothetical protein
MKKPFTCVFGMAVCALSLLPGAFFPGSSLADIYRWEDDQGVIHFTDDPGEIPAKYRSRGKAVMQGPPPSGQPSLSTIGAPASSPIVPVLPGRGPDLRSGMPEPDPEDLQAEAQTLRSRISAKETFIEGIDRKRSNILNPMGNRFVSPEDLELYKKYSEELPKDRDRLKEMEAGAP